MAERYKRNPNIECLTCKKSIYRRPVEIKLGRVFCSSRCYGIANRREVFCVVCKKPILASAHAKTCGRSCANVHRAGIRYKIGSPKDKVKDQRAVKLRVFAVKGEICERCGYTKKEILNVHHKDKNKQNNDLKNLELLCPNCHAEKHYLERSWLKQRN